MIKISTLNEFDKHQYSLKFCSTIAIKACSAQNIIITSSLHYDTV